MITIEQMIQREVLCCMSSMVSTLARGSTGIGEHRSRNNGHQALKELAEQAEELASPVLDYEEAARQVGWKTNSENKIYFDDNGQRVYAKSWEATYYGGEDILPYEWEVYEHWAVSKWFAEQLMAQGERVDDGFAGLNVWARTCTGQAISGDGVVQKIYAEMMQA